MPGQGVGRLVAGTCAMVIAVALVGCGGGAMSLSLDQVKSNLEHAGYKVTSYSPGEGALSIDATHTADAGISIGYSPSGQQLYGSVYETTDPAVRTAIISHNSAESTPVVRGSLIFTLSGTEPELRKIVADAGDAPLPGSGAGSGDVAGAKAAMQGFIVAYAAGDENVVCASFTPQVLGRSQTFCDPASAFYRREPDPRVNQYEISGVTATGNTATATVSFQGITEQVALRKVAGVWKIDTPLGAGRLF